MGAGAMGIVSVVDSPKRDRFLTDMAKALNLLHISASSHALNLYHSTKHVGTELMPLIYADFDCESINDLLYDFMSSENFRWKRMDVIYDPVYGKYLITKPMLFTFDSQNWNFLFPDVLIDGKFI